MVTFRTGKVIDPNRGFIGLNTCFQISDGYDSEILYSEDFGDTYDPSDTGVLTRAERLELCDTMIARWQEFKKTQEDSA